MADSELLSIGDVISDSPMFSAPAGDYRFKVVGWERGTYQAKEGSKIPSCETLVFKLAIPYRDEDGSIVYSETRYSLKLVKRLAFLISQFFEGVGVMREGGKFQIDPDKAVGKAGVCEVIQQVSGTGDLRSYVNNVYVPSKRPAVTENDSMPFEKPVDASEGVFGDAIDF